MGISVLFLFLIHEFLTVIHKLSTSLDRLNADFQWSDFSSILLSIILC